MLYRILLLLRCLGDLLRAIILKFAIKHLDEVNVLLDVVRVVEPFDLQPPKDLADLDLPLVPDQ